MGIAPQNSGEKRVANELTTTLQKINKLSDEKRKKVLIAIREEMKNGLCLIDAVTLIFNKKDFKDIELILRNKPLDKSKKFGQGTGKGISLHVCLREKAQAVLIPRGGIYRTSLIGIFQMFPYFFL